MKTISGLGYGAAAPVFVLFFLSRGITVGQFTYLFAILNATILATELPTGIIADRVSRKLSVQL